MITPLSPSRHDSRKAARKYLEGKLLKINPGEPMPPIRVLMKESGSSLARLNGLLRELASEGLVDRQPRKGIFKAFPRPETGVVPYIEKPISRGNKPVMVLGLVLDSWPGGVQNGYLEQLFVFLRRHVARSPQPCRLVYEFVDMTEGEGGRVRLLSSPGADGVIFMPFSPQGLAFLNGYRNGQRPVICFGRPLDNDRIPQVYIDHYDGAVKATEYLGQLGHRRIGYISIPAFSGNPSSLRLKGFRETMARRGMTVEESDVAESPFDYQAVERGLAKVFGSNKPPTGLFVADGVLLGPVLHALGRLGKRIPEDVSVVSYDDTPESRSYHPPITVIRQPLESAMEVLLQEATAWADNRPDKQRKRVLPPELVVRASMERII